MHADAPEGAEWIRLKEVARVAWVELFNAELKPVTGRMTNPG